MESLASKISLPALARMASSEQQPATCAQHGGYTSWLIKGEWSGCVECMKVADIERENQQREQWRKELIDRRWREKLGRAAIPEKFADRTLASYEAENDGQKKALATVQRYVEHFDEAMLNGSCLLMCGMPGTGKTHLAIGIAHEVMKRGHSAVFVKLMKAVDSVKETYARDSKETRQEVIREYIEPDLLIFDEAGMQRGTDEEKAIIFEIIDGRYEKSKPTIITSNLAAKALEEIIGERSFDRLREGNGKMIVFDWPSYRSRRIPP